MPHFYTLIFCLAELGFYVTKIFTKTLVVIMFETSAEGVKVFCQMLTSSVVADVILHAFMLLVELLNYM